MHRNTPRIFSGHSSRVYDFAARRLLRRFYRRLADDIAAAAPQDAAVLDVGTGPGLELLPQLQAVLRALAEQGEQCVPDAHGALIPRNIPRNLLGITMAGTLS